VPGETSCPSARLISGIIIDGTVVMMENIYRETWPTAAGTGLQNLQRRVIAAAGRAMWTGPDFLFRPR